MGFSLVGVTTCEALPHADVFETWLELGRQGEMTYLDTPRSRACRAHPDLLLPECRSVLVLGMRYPATTTAEGKHSATIQSLMGRSRPMPGGRIIIIPCPIGCRSLVEFIEGQVGHAVPNRWYADTGPILERELAQRAGLGWIGKNTCLINPHGGSYFLLAEILLGIDLEPDPAFCR